MNTYLRRKHKPESAGSSFLKLPLKDKAIIRNLIINCGIAIGFNQPYQPIIHTAKQGVTGKLGHVMKALTIMSKEEFNNIIDILLKNDRTK